MKRRAVAGAARPVAETRPRSEAIRGAHLHHVGVQIQAVHVGHVLEVLAGVFGADRKPVVDLRGPKGGDEVLDWPKKWSWRD